MIACIEEKPQRTFFKIDLFIFRERGREGERERNINVWLLLVHPLPGTCSHNLGTCPDWESNWRPFGSQAGTQSTELLQPGQIYIYKYTNFIHNTKYFLKLLYLFFDVLNFYERGKVIIEHRKFYC